MHHAILESSDNDIVFHDTPSGLADRYSNLIITTIKISSYGNVSATSLWVCLHVTSRWSILAGVQLTLIADAIWIPLWLIYMAVPSSTCFLLNFFLLLWSCGSSITYHNAGKNHHRCIKYTHMIEDVNFWWFCWILLVIINLIRTYYVDANNIFWL